MMPTQKFVGHLNGNFHPDAFFYTLYNMDYTVQSLHDFSYTEENLHQ